MTGQFRRGPEQAPRRQADRRSSPPGPGSPSLGTRHDAEQTCRRTVQTPGAAFPRPELATGTVSHEIYLHSEMQPRNAAVWPRQARGTWGLRSVGSGARGVCLREIGNVLQAGRDAASQRPRSPGRPCIPWSSEALGAAGAGVCG